MNAIKIDLKFGDPPQHALTQLSARVEACNFTRDRFDLRRERKVGQN